MKRTGRLFALLLTVILLFTVLSVCGKANRQNIIILYTNDVHCAIYGKIGYAGLAAYK